MDHHKSNAYDDFTKQSLMNQLAYGRKEINSYLRQLNSNGVSVTEKGISLSTDYCINQFDSLINNIIQNDVITKWNVLEKDKTPIIHNELIHLITNNTINIDLKSWKYYNSQTKLTKITYLIRQYFKEINNSLNTNKATQTLMLILTNNKFIDNIVDIVENEMSDFDFYNITVNSFFFPLIEHKLNQLQSINKDIIKAFNYYKTKC